MSLSRTASSNYKTTILGVLLAVSEIIGAAPDFSAMTWQELLTRSVKAAVIVFLGMLARDGTMTSPSDGAHDGKA